MGRNDIIYVLCLCFILVLLSFICKGQSPHEIESNKLVKLALEQEHNGQESTAIGTLTKALELNNKNGIAYKERGDLYVIFGAYDKALIDYKKALSLNPNEELYYRIGVNEHRMGDDEAGIRHLNKAIEMNPKNEFYYFFRGDCNLNLGKFRAAIHDFDQAAKLVPNDYQAYYKRGVALFNVHEYQHCISDFTKAIQLHPYNDDFYFYRGSAYFNLAKYSQAIADFEVCLQKNPDNHDALLRRAMSHEYSENYALADVDYTAYLNQHPKNAKISYMSANVKYSLGDFSGAENMYSKVIARKPKDKMAYFHRGMARFNQAKSNKSKLDLACKDFVMAKNLGYLAGYNQMKGNCK